MPKLSHLLRQVLADSRSCISLGRLTSRGARCGLYNDTDDPGNSFHGSSFKIALSRVSGTENASVNGAIGSWGRRETPRGCSFNRRFVLLSGAHFHAKSLTSEHLLLLNAFFCIEGSESCGAGRAHFRERGPEQRAPGGRGTALSPAGPCPDLLEGMSRVP